MAFADKNMRHSGSTAISERICNRIRVQFDRKWLWTLPRIARFVAAQGGSAGLDEVIRMGSDQP
jgi:hypothetical protein